MSADDVFDHPVAWQVPDVEGGMAIVIAQQVAEKSFVLLKNKCEPLPLDPSHIHSVLLIGGHADNGVLSGGGSAQVSPPGGSAVPPEKRSEPTLGASLGP